MVTFIVLFVLFAIVMVIVKANSPATKTDIMVAEDGARTKIIRDNRSAGRSASRFIVGLLLISVALTLLLIIVGANA